MWTRIITGLILAPAVLWALFILPPIGVQILMGAVLVVAAWEASAMIGFEKSLSRYLFMIALTAVGVIAVMNISSGSEPAGWVIVLMIAAGAWWLAYIVLLSRFSIARPGVYGSKIGRLTNIVIILLTSWIALNATYMFDPQLPLLLVYMLILIWVADSGAYFAGKLLGTHKLAPEVSPGKTIEGLIGAVIAASIFSAFYSCAVLDISGLLLVKWVLLAIFVTLVSIAGDLNESALKRVSGMKDSGSIIPGHGGFFDRIDAITAAAPIFYLGWKMFHWGLAG